MTFLSPWWLLFLVPVAALAAAYVSTGRRRQRYVVRFSTLPMLEKLVPKRPTWRRHLPAGLVLLALTGLAVAGARPQISREEPYDRATVIVAIDASGSMEATDVAPNRLVAAREAAQRFIAELPPTVEVGVVAFAANASVLSSPTVDHAEAAISLDGLRLGSSTAIGDGVITSLAQVQGLARETPDGQPVPARIVLLSDGGNTTGASLQVAAEQATAAGVPVSTIAYGTTDGRLGGGRAVPVDAASLAALAESTGGSAYRAEDRDELESVYSDIGSIVGYRTVDTEITSYLTVVGLVLAMIAGGLSLRWFSRLV